MSAAGVRESDNPVLIGPYWPVFFRYALPSVAGLLALARKKLSASQRRAADEQDLVQEAF